MLGALAREGRHGEVEELLPPRPGRFDVEGRLDGCEARGRELQQHFAGL